MFILNIVAACIAVVSLMYAGTAEAEKRYIASVTAVAIGDLALVGMTVLGVMVGNESCPRVTVSMPSPCPSFSAHEGGEAGFDDTAWDAVAVSEESHEVCDVRDNDCGDTPISYSDDGCEVTIHYKDGDVRIPNLSGCRAWWDDVLTP